MRLWYFIEVCWIIIKNNSKNNDYNDIELDKISLKVVDLLISISVKMDYYFIKYKFGKLITIKSLLILCPELSQKQHQH